MSPWQAVGIAWLAGGLPSAWVAGRLHGVDLRTVGSGNLGATNVVRTLGWPTGLAVYVVDCLKGALPVLWLPRLAGLAGPAAVTWAIVIGVAAILGHVRSPWLLFRGGGKGVATASGVFVGLAPGPTLLAVAVFAAVVAGTRYVSLGSMSAAAVLPIAVFVQQGGSPVFLASVAVGAFVVWTHRANIGRLRRGEESRIGGRPRPASGGEGG
jgi:glycerol-3-phosphate acyltransferase PlsY